MSEKNGNGGRSNSIWPRRARSSHVEPLEHRTLLTATSFYHEPWIDFINQPVLLAPGDLNNDGKPDVAALVSVDGGTALELHVLLGDGYGVSDVSNSYLLTDPNRPVYPVDAAAAHMQIADVNGDGFGDVIVDSPTTESVEVFLSKGNGLLEPGIFTHTGTISNFVVADVNYDGKPDLIAGGNVFLGHGDGTFGSPIPINGVQGGMVAIADVNGDGKPDVIDATNGSTLTVSLGNGDGTFQPPMTFNDGIANPMQITAVDLNGDGNPDVVVGGTDGTVSVLLNKGGGSFAAPTTYATLANPQYILVADFQGSDRPEIELGFQSPEPYEYVLTNNGDGTFKTTHYNTAEWGHYSAVAADFNLDGKIDFLGTRIDALNLDLNTTHDGTRKPAPSFPNASDQYTGYVQVFWDVSSNADDYVVYRGTSATFADAKRIDVTQLTYFRDTSAEAGRRYYYWVRARTSTMHSAPTGPAAGVALKANAKLRT